MRQSRDICLNSIYVYKKTAPVDFKQTKCRQTKTKLSAIEMPICLNGMWVCSPSNVVILASPYDAASSIWVLAVSQCFSGNNGLHVQRLQQKSICEKSLIFWHIQCGDIWGVTVTVYWIFQFALHSCWLIIILMMCWFFCIIIFQINIILFKWY